MRILVTGVSGFIGRHLIPLLDGHELILLDKAVTSPFPDKGQYLCADLADPVTWAAQLKELAPEVAIHLAWKGLPDYSLEMCLENLNISARLFEALMKNGCRKVFAAGTCWEYGSAQGVRREDDAPGTQGTFAACKTALRLLGQSLAAQHKADFIWGRLFFIYGPGQRQTSLIPSCYDALLRGEAPSVKNPQAVCDFIHVLDAARAIKALIEADGVSGVFNIGSGHYASAAQVCGHVADVLGKKNAALSSAGTGAPDGFWADVTRLARMTGWKPEMSLRQGIEMTIREWSKAHAHG